MNIIMRKKTLSSFTLFLCLAYFITSGTAFSFVLREAGKIYIVGQTGERWDVTKAKSIGFDPHRFQYGIGREAFTPLDESFLSDDTFFVSGGLRVIGVKAGTEAHAYSVPKLRRHEIANTTIDSEPIAVGY
ncbi:MAG: DUF3179 domain-containing protein [Deltaproteobacteria bacterium]|nr:DUF3179 domain-containing protein [Deltaproteobacteria bacterium]MBW1848703.1 DUF3179 domain-containing protein [Deltaproteobacteria bacterium]